MRTAFLLLLFLIPIPAVGQINAPLVENSDGIYVEASQDVTEVISGDKFHGAMVKAIRASAKSGKITRGRALRLRVAMLAPSFRAQAKDLAMIQMVFSADGDALPRTADGRIDETAIDWEGLALFLERLLPILERLLILFGA